MKALSLSLPLLFLVGCLGSPEIPECDQVPFALSSQEEECGSPCAIYCDRMLDQCPEVFDDRLRCLDECEVEPDPSLRNGTFADTTGNTVGCRLNALRAGGDDACREASLDETSICIDSACDDYCESMVNGPCTGAYNNLNECLITCSLIPTGRGDVDVNTVECRLRYALEAERAGPGDVRGLCHSASRTGGGTCGEICASYCGFVMQNCRGEGRAIYSSAQECLNVCELMDSENGSFDDWDFSLERDTVDCRAYHGSGPASQQPEEHCPHAQVFNPIHCGVLGGAEADPWPCTAFCNSVVDNCPGFDSVAQCEPICANIPRVQAVMNDMSNSATVNIFPQGTQMCPDPTGGG